jgi:hypothetical protein
MMLAAFVRAVLDLPEPELAGVLRRLDDASLCTMARVYWGRAEACDRRTSQRTRPAGDREEPRAAPVPKRRFACREPMEQTLNGVRHILRVALVPLTTAQIAEKLGVDRQRVRAAVRALADASEIESERPKGSRVAGWTLSQRPAAKAPPEPAPAPPGLEAGEGERREDCRHYSACLGRFWREHKRGRDGPARCPASCVRHDPITTEERLKQADRRDGSIIAGGA